MLGRSKSYIVDVIRCSKSQTNMELNISEQVLRGATGAYRDGCSNEETDKSEEKSLRVDKYNKYTLFQRG